MTKNNSLVGVEFLMRSLDFRVILVQVLVALFLCVNSLLITTFFMKEFFYTTVRYILFAITLLSDCLILIVTDILLIFVHFNLAIQMWLCVIFYILSSVYSLVTPVTLMAMTLERYVAICMPLRHAELCSTRSTVRCIVIIHCISSVPCIVILLAFFASASLSLYSQYKICSAEMLFLHSWQSHFISAIYQLYFLIMCITVVFSYVKIMKVAKAASGEDKKSSRKGLRTVILHGFQLLLCLIQMWCPFINSAVLEVNFMLYFSVRYFNFVTFYLAPRCLSPLIYGLRDEKFFHALKYYTLCCFCRNFFIHLKN
ncbi:Nociceptin receptor [Collichthys lucidus]|uniref:Nociceptin receptor n=1 Tax=Collichthys lucidus TaxID=240159 RepID=A0A4U5UZC9_COLLU|nr:Nociceptin receptor [Collichthys lucidus]